MTALVRYDAACHALAEARRIDEVKDIADKAEAMRVYAQQSKNPQLEADAWEIRERARNRFGELSAALDKALVDGHTGNIRLPNGGKSKTEVLKEVGISTSAANRYEHFSRLPADEKEARIAKGRAAIEAGKSVADAILRGDEKAERRADRERDLGAMQRALPTKKYGVIYADPPWKFAPYSNVTGMDRAADNHYPTMDVGGIMALPVPSADDAVLFLWATVPMLVEAIEVLEAWGFEYKSGFVWVKDRIGTGYWARNRHELLLIGTKGKIPAPAMGQQFDSVIDAPVGDHSAKPFAVHEMIEEMFPSLPRIELFAREQFEGWDAWGNEIAA